VYGDGEAKENVMRRKTLWLIIALALILAIMGGCKGEPGEPPESEKLEGKEVPEYAALLDPDVWAVELDPKEIAESEEEAKIIEMGLKALGILNWEKVSLEAREADGSIGVRSIMKYAGEEGTLMDLLSKVQPAESAVIKALTRDDLVGMFSVGNYEGGFNAFLEWLIEGDYVENMLKETGGQEAAGFWPMAKGWLIGMRETLKEDVYPFVGDECALAIYMNEDFVGWEKMMEAETTAQALPVRVLGVLSTEKTGFGGTMLDTMEEIVMSSPMGMFLMMAGGEEGLIPEPETEKGDGYDIYYLDFGDDVKIAWAEYEGGLFISSLDTIENLPDYYDPKKPAEGTPSKYNAYAMFDLDTCVENFYTPFRETVAGALEEAKETEDAEEMAAFEEIFGLLNTAGELGTCEFINHLTEDGCVTTLKFSSAAGPLVLKMYEAGTLISQIISETMEQEMGMMGAPGMMEGPDMYEDESEYDFGDYDYEYDYGE
jgi:hypothetical protein